jgi:hypothetical protein
MFRLCKKRCPHCSGKGWIPDPWPESKSGWGCSVCNGTGSIQMNWKIIIGSLLIILGLILCLGTILFRFNNPTLTETQLCDTIGFIPILAELILFMYGKEESEDE